ncbi:MAG TPA: FAD-binding protein [Streptosporangiaceae bacterium]|nr:FAD-binding protein [Streptosporangiaceae bacterium]
MSVLCLVEHSGDGSLADPSLGALALAGGLADGEGLAVVLFGELSLLAAAELGSHGVSDAYVVGPGSVDGYAPLAWARVLAGLAAGPRAAGGGPAAGPAAGVVIAAGTDRGNEVMAHLGAITQQPMAANCVSVEAAGPGEFRLVRQRWAGLLLEDAVLSAAPALVTVAADAPVPPRLVPSADVAVHDHRPQLADGDLRVRAAVSTTHASGASLATARVVVGGGRGVGGPDGFAALEELAALLGGVVGVSRVVTSEGWRPHSQQVGQTGTKITPELYLACGISGAIQHMAGCSSAKHIVAVNTDPGAPILARADYAVIGDLNEVIPALVAALRSRA